MRAGTAPSEEDMVLLDGLYHDETVYLQRQVLATSPEVQPDKVKLLSLLRKHGVFVWSRGSIEHYYPAGVAKDDKPTMALAACRLVNSAEQARACCATGNGEANGRCEFEHVFSAIFG